MKKLLSLITILFLGLTLQTNATKFKSQQQINLYKKILDNYIIENECTLDEFVTGFESLTGEDLKIYISEGKEEDIYRATSPKIYMHNHFVDIELPYIKKSFGRYILDEKKIYIRFIGTVYIGGSRLTSSPRTEFYYDDFIKWCEDPNTLSEVLQEVYKNTYEIIRIPLNTSERSW